MLPSAITANYLIKKSFDDGIPLNTLKLLKLVYLAHGMHLGYFSKNLIQDGVFAWSYGPIISHLYEQTYHYGKNAIDHPLDEYPCLDNLEAIQLPEIKLPHPDTLKLVDLTWHVYSKYSGVELSVFTEEEGSPWSQIWQNAQQEYGEQLGERTNIIIPNKLIDSYYKKEIAEMNAKKERESRLQ